MVSALRRDQIWREDAKTNFVGQTREEFIAGAAALLEDIQASLHREATEKRDANITRGLTTLEQLAEFFSEDKRYPGWVELNWSRPTGAALDKVVEQLKALKLTIRNTALDAAPAQGLPLHRRGGSGTDLRRSFLLIDVETIRRRCSLLRRRFAFELRWLTTCGSGAAWHIRAHASLHAPCCSPAARRRHCATQGTRCAFASTLARDRGITGRVRNAPHALLAG
jgi:hypothetical protein